MRFFVLLLFPIIVFSQERDFGSQNGFFDNNLDFFALQKVKNKSNTNYIEGVKGSPYLHNEWEKCKVYPSNSTSNFAIDCNYNVYLDQFEVKAENDIYALNPESINSISFNQKIFIPNKSVGGKNYFELLGENQQLKVVKLYDSKVREVQTNTLGLIESKLIIHDKNYFLMNNGKLIKIPSSKSKIFDILNLSSEQEKLFKNYNLKNIDELISLIHTI